MSKVLIISPDTIPIQNHLAAGPGIRSWEIATALKTYGHDITIAVPKECFNSDIDEYLGVKIRRWDFENLIKLCDNLDAVFLPQGKIDLSEFFVRHIRDDLCVIVDVYDPNLIEFLNLFTSDKNGIATFSKCLTGIVPLLKRGDFFVCANNRQRYYYLGVLNVLGRINPLTYNEKLIDIVPFGVPDEDPVYEEKNNVMRGSIVKKDDLVVLWFGGIYPWFDAITLIKAIDIAVKKNPKIKLVIMGAVHPRGYTPTENYIKTLELTKQLGLHNRNVFFTEWRPYNERIYWYREADIGICTYPMHLETELSNRTRVIDMLWGGLPIITTEGDEVSSLIKQYECGESVKPNDPEGLAEVLVDILCNNEKRKRMADNTKKLVDERLRWKKVVKPLSEFLNNPVISMDRRDEFTSNTLLWQVDTLERHRAFLPTEQKLLELEIKNKEQQIIQLNQEIGKYVEVIRGRDRYSADLEKIINERDRYSADLEKIINERDRIINEIYSSTSWGVLTKLHRAVDWSLPAATRRRRYFDKVVIGLKTIANEGLRSFWWKFIQFYKSNITIDYNHWILENEPGKEDLMKMRGICESFKYKPKISIIIPVWNTDEKWLRSVIESVLCQLYDNFELCIADGGSTKPEVKRILDEYTKNDSRIKVKFLTENKGIAVNSNEALSLATGEFVGFLDHDDELSPFALYEVIKLLNEHPDANLIYSDEDNFDEKGRRMNPFFKPDWSLPMFLSTNYICHFLVYRKSMMQKVSGFREGFDGSQDYDLALRVVEKIPIDSIFHIPMVLYHWRISPLSASSGRDAKPYAYEAGRKAIEEYLLRNHIEGEVKELKDPGSYRVRKTVKNMPPIDLIIVPDVVGKHKNLDGNIQNNLIEIIRRSNYKLNKIYVPTNIDLPEGTKYSQLSNEEFDKIIKSSDSNYIIFMGSSLLGREPFIKPSSDWIEALVEHFPYFKIGVVGTGTFIYGNIVHNVYRPCGRIFCVGKSLFQSYLENRTNPSNFDDIQINLADYVVSIGYENLFTPHSVGNQFDTRRINKYYSNLEENPFLTENMKYYLPKLDK